MNFVRRGIDAATAKLGLRASSKVAGQPSVGTKRSAETISTKWGRRAADSTTTQEVPTTREFNYIIVGGGSAGCAMANRLSADPNNEVLVLEAGRKDWKWDVFIHMPAALTYPIGSRFYDWKYESEPEPHMNGRRVYHCLLYTSPSPRDQRGSRMPSSA